MISPKESRSPVGQKLIHDLMLDDEDLGASAFYDDVGDVDDATSARLRAQLRGSGPLRPSRRSQHLATGQSPTVLRSITSALPGTGRDLPFSSPRAFSPDRPATAPATTNHMILPPQLPAARNPRDSKAAPMSPILERHLVSRHTSAYLGGVTAVLHQVASPATTGVPRDTQRRPGTIPRDVYHHVVVTPRRASPGSEASQLARGAGPSAGTDEGFLAGTGSGLVTSSGGANGGGGASRVSTFEGGRRSLSPSAAAAALGPAPGGSDSCLPQMSLIHRGGMAALEAGVSVSVSGAPGQDGYVPYLDRSYGSHAPLACAVDSVARRAEAHKSLTRQRLLHKQQQEQQQAGGGKGVVGLHGNESQHQQQPQIVLFQQSSAEPYQLRMDGGMHPVSLGLNWDASPGVVAAAAATAAAAAAAIAARAEGLGSNFVSYSLYDPPGSAVARAVGFSTTPQQHVHQQGLGTLAGANGAASQPTGGIAGGRRRRGAPMWSSMPPGSGMSGLGTPAGAPESPYGVGICTTGSPARKMRLPRTPQSAMEAAVLAVEADAAVRAHLPPAVRRGYSGQLAPQTIQDWEIITEPNRRMMQAIENVTNLVRSTPSRSGSRASPADFSSGAGSHRLPAAGREARGTGARASAAGAGCEPSALSSTSATGPYGSHTSARARRRYIRYSLDILPELGLPGRGGDDGGAAVAMGGASGAASGAQPSSWGGWPPQTERADEYGSVDTEASGADATTEAGDGSGGAYTPIHYTAAAAAAAAAARGGSAGSGSMRYIPAAAARVPVPVHLHPLPTPTAVVAAVVAGGGAAGAAAAALPQWVDTLAAATCAAATSSVATLHSSASEPPYSLPDLSSAGSGGLPGVISSSGSFPAGGVGGSSVSVGGGRRSPSRSSSMVTHLAAAAAAAAGLGARGVALQGHPTGPSPSPAPSLDVSAGGASRGWSLSGSQSLRRRDGRSDVRLLEEHLAGATAATAARAGPAAASRAAVDALDGDASLPLTPFDVSAPASPPAIASYAPSPELSLMLHLSARPTASGGPSSPEPQRSPARHAAHPSHPHPHAVELDLNPNASLVLAADRSFVLDEGLGTATAAGAARAAAAAGSRRSSGGWGAPPAPPSQSDRSPSPSPSPSLPSIADSTPTSRLSTPAAFELPLDLGPRESLGPSPLGAGAGPASQAALQQSGARLPSLTGAEPHAAQQQQQLRLSDSEIGAGRSRREGEGAGEGRQTDSSAEEEPSSLLPLRSAALGAARLSQGPSQWLPLAKGSAAGRASRTATTAAAAEEDAEGYEGPELKRGLETAETSFPGGGGDGMDAAGTMPSSSETDSVRQGDAAAAAGEAKADATSVDAKAAAAASGEGDVRRPSPLRVTAVTPQGPVLTPGASYRVVTSVAAALVSEDPREVARAAVQRELEEQLQRSSGVDREMKLKAASRASKALAKATPQAALPSLTHTLGGVAIPATMGYSIVQPRMTFLGDNGAGTGGGGGHSVVMAAPVPAAAEMEAMATAARALLAPAPAAQAARGPQQQQQQQQPAASTTPGARRAPDQAQPQGSQSRSPDRRSTTPPKPGSYYHVEAAIEGGRTAHIQDVWAA